MTDPRRPDAATRRRIALRSTLLQAAWNYETLQGVGFAWSILPGLERLYPDREARARRLAAFLEVFNSNPYLSTLGLGVALRMEGEVARDVAGAERRRTRLLRALRGSLGALGDELFWAAWRPALALAATILALGWWTPWAAPGFVLAFNGLAQGVRARGVRAGYASGAGIARVLQDPFWHRATELTRAAGAAAAGAALSAGTVWSFADAGGPRGLAVFLLAFALLWLMRARIGTGRLPLTPPLAFLTVLILLSAVYQLVDGASP